MRTAKIFKKYQIAVWVVVSFYALVSHWIIPKYNKGEDFFIFSQWDLFSRPVSPVVFDLTWDGGKTFLFRDYQDQLKRGGVETSQLFRATQLQELSAPKNEQNLLILKNICQCSRIKIATISSSFYEHILLKKTNLLSVKDI